MALSKDRAQKLDTILGQLEKGENLSVTFYENDHYRTWEGTLEAINIPFRFLRIDGKVIPFRHIWEIRKNYQVGREKNDCGSSSFLPALPTKAASCRNPVPAKGGTGGLSLSEKPLPVPL